MNVNAFCLTITSGSISGSLGVRDSESETLTPKNGYLTPKNGCQEVCDLQSISHMLSLILMNLDLNTVYSVIYTNMVFSPII